MKTKNLCFAFILSTVFSVAQNKTKNPVETIISKNSLQFGLQTNFALGVSSKERKAMASGLINPKLSYFIADRWSLGLGYIGVKSDLLPTQKNKLYHNAELELKYYLKARGRFLVYTQASLIYGQYMPVSWTNPVGRDWNTVYKLGAGVNWILKRNPNIGFNLELNNYFTRASSGKLKFTPNISAGVCMKINSKKKKKLPVTND